MDKFQEAYQLFTKKQAAIRSRRNGLAAEIERLKSEIKRLQREYEGLVSLGEAVEAEQVKHQMTQAVEKLNCLEAELRGIGGAELIGAKRASRSNPDSELHRLAATVQEAAPVVMQALADEFEEAMTALERTRNSYLETVKTLGEKYRALQALYREVKEVSEFLPAEKHANLTTPPVVKLKQIQVTPEEAKDVFQSVVY